MKTIVFAYHTIGCEAIKTLHRLGEEISAVFTHEDDPGENRWFGSVKETAGGLNIPVYTPQDPNTADWIEKIRSLNPEIIYSFYYRKLICDQILAIPPKGALNLHGSLLPKYRGRAPVNWVLVQGEKETGLTFHYMVKKPDSGDIVAQKKLEISDKDTAHSLFKKLLPLTEEILSESVPKLSEGTAPKIPQDHSQSSTFGARKPEDGKIDWTRPAKEIYNLVRAVTHPYPGAFTYLNGKKVLIWRANPFKPDKPSGKPGMISSLDPLTVSCGKGELILEAIQMENGEEMSAGKWAMENELRAGQIIN